jgi:hypothetical protein
MNLTLARGRTARRLFILTLLMTAFLHLFLVADRRMPLGHRTRTLYEQQLATAGGGVRSGAWFDQATLLQNAILPFASAFRGVPFLPLFYLGIFLEEAILLVGIWLLGAKLFRSIYSRFLVSVATLGSSLWIDHAALNLLAFSTLPLLLYLLHEFLESNSRKALLTAGLLMILQTPGRPPALALLVPAAAALYWVGRTWLFGYPLRDRLRQSPWGKREWAWTGAFVLVWAAVWACSVPGTGALVDASTVRLWSPRVLLSGAGLRNPLAYADLVLGLTPDLDSTVFCGYFTLAFAVTALAGLGLRTLLRLLALLTVSLALMGLLPPLSASLLPIPFPADPPTQGVPLLRLFIMVLAGFGCDRLFQQDARGAGVHRSVALGLLGLSAGMACVFVLNPNDDSLIDRTAQALTLGAPRASVSPFIAQIPLVPDLYATAALMSGLAGGTLLLRGSGLRQAPFALALLLFLHPLDVFGWKFRMTWLKSSSLSASQWSDQRLGSTASPDAGRSVLTPPPVAFLHEPYGAPQPPFSERSAGEESRFLPLLRAGRTWGLGALSILGVLWLLRILWLLASGRRE